MSTLIIGAHGQLGQCLSDKEFFKNSIFLNRNDLDFNNSNWKDKLHSYDFSTLINCTAYTEVDKAEEQEFNNLNNLMNAQVPGEIAEICQAKKATLIHFSTDYVFDGKSHIPYIETDSVASLNKYGQSKLQGEKNIMDSCEKYFIFRLSWLYSKYRKNFLLTIKNLLATKDQLTIIDDQISTPTNAHFLTNNLVELINSNSKEFGLYHYSDFGTASWYDFAQAIKTALKNTSCPIKPIPSSAYAQKAKRPHYSKLNTQKTQSKLPFTFEHWSINLNTTIQELQK